MAFGIAHGTDHHLCRLATPRTKPDINTKRRKESTMKTTEVKSEQIFRLTNSSDDDAYRGTLAEVIAKAACWAKMPEADIEATVTPDGEMHALPRGLSLAIRPVAGRLYEISDTDTGPYGECEAASVKDALTKAISGLSVDVFDDNSGPAVSMLLYVKVTEIERDGEGESDEATELVHPETPPCERIERAHQWGNIPDGFNWRRNRENDLDESYFNENDDAYFDEICSKCGTLRFVTEKEDDSSHVRYDCITYGDGDDDILQRLGRFNRRAARDAAN